MHTGAFKMINVVYFANIYIFIFLHVYIDICIYRYLYLLVCGLSFRQTDLLFSLTIVCLRNRNLLLGPSDDI